MLTQAKADSMNREVTAFLDRQFLEAPGYKASLLSLWQTYLALGLPNTHFVKEFTSGRRASAFQRAWEMMLARHLVAQGHQLTSPDHGPDFCFEHRGLTVWVEAVSPEPKAVPSDWMEGPKPNEFKVGTFPHNEILLRDALDHLDEPNSLWRVLVQEPCFADAQPLKFFWARAKRFRHPRDET